MQHGQDILDSLAEIKIALTGRYEQWRENSASAQFQSAGALVSNFPPPQLVARRGVQSHDASTPLPSSTPSGSHSRAPMPRSRTPSPYRQSPNEDDKAWRERADAILRDEARRRDETSAGDVQDSRSRALMPRSRTPSPYRRSLTEDDKAWHERADAIPRDEARRRGEASASGVRPEQSRLANEDDARRRQGREEEGEKHRLAEQSRHEQFVISRRQQEAEFVATLAARFGEPSGQNQIVALMPQLSVQYPSVPGPVTSNPAPTGQIANHLQIPLESLTQYVIHQLKHSSLMFYGT